MGGHLGFRWKHGTAAQYHGEMSRVHHGQAEKARGGRVPTRRTRCATPDRDTKEREREREGKRGEKGVAEREISAATTTYGSVAGTLDERSRSIELPGSPSLCLSDFISLAFHSPTTVSLSRILFARSFSLPLLFTRSFATRRESEATDEWGRSDKCRWRSMGPVWSWCVPVKPTVGQHAPRYRYSPRDGRTERERERESVSSKTNCQLVGVVDFYANTVDTVGPEGFLVLSIPAEFVISADLMEMLRETLRMCEYAKILRIRFSRREYRVVTACSYRENLIFLCHIDQVSFQLLKY